MKTMKYLFAAIATLIAFTSCEEDGDKIYLQSLNGNELMASTSDVTLSPDEAQQIVLSFAWTDQTIAVSDENVGTAAKVVTNLEASLSEDFSGTVSTTETTSLSHAFTGAQLNTVANAIGATVGQPNAVWFRLGSATGTNIPSAYSNAVSVSVTPYEMDMNTGTVLLSNDNNENLGETGVTFHSPNADGIYSGFISIPYGWYHILFQEGNGLIWGTAGDDGAFHITSDAANNRQNMWFPEATGCYYVSIDTRDEEWSALHISSLTVSGLSDEDAAMTLDRESNQWIATFTADATGPRTITVTGQGEQYNVTTGINPPSETTAVAFAMEGESLVLAETAGSITVEVPQAGECTLRLNLSDPKNCTAAVEAGSAEVPTVTYPETLDLVYFPEEGGETVLTTLNAVNKEEGTYTGTYTIGQTDRMNLVDRTNGIWYDCVPVDGSDGLTLSTEDGKWNLWFSNVSGTVTINVNLSEMKWEYSEKEVSEEDEYPERLHMVQWAADNAPYNVLLTLNESGTSGIYTGNYTGTGNPGNFSFIDPKETQVSNNQISNDGTWVWYGKKSDNQLYNLQINGSDLWFDGTYWSDSNVNYTITVDLTQMTWSITDNSSN